MSSPSDFAAPEIEFKKLDDLPGKGLGKAYTPDQIMAAMKVLHKMIHAQAKAYGGKNSKLLAAGIAEGSLLQTVTSAKLTDVVEESIDDEMEAAYQTATELQKHLTDETSMKLVLKLIKHINTALAQTAK